MDEDKERKGRGNCIFVVDGDDIDQLESECKATERFSAKFVSNIKCSMTFV